jgi:hypothetical protein
VCDKYLADVEPLDAAYREIMGRHFPAMAVVEVNRLVEPQARLERLCYRSDTPANAVETALMIKAPAST